MLDYTFVKEVVKRRWYVLVLVTVLFAVIGVLVSLPKDSSGPVVTRYSAEATVYYHEQDAVGTVNSSDLQGYNLADVQRVVLSDSVAGTVREAFSDDVTISSPYWKNVDTNANMNTRFIAVVATAASQDEATKAAQMAAELAVNAVNTKLSGITASIYEDAVPVPTGSSSATNFGTAALNVTPSVAVASGISWKRVVVIALLGLVVGFVVLIVGGLARCRVRAGRSLPGERFGIASLWGRYDPDSRDGSPPCRPVQRGQTRAVRFQRCGPARERGRRAVRAGRLPQCAGRVAESCRRCVCA